MNLKTVLLKVGGKAYKFFEIEYVPPEPIDWSDIKSKEGYSKKAFCLLSNGKYNRVRQSLFDKIIQSEKHDRYAWYNKFEDDQEALCNTALVYTADMLDHGKSYTEIAAAMNLEPMTIVEIVKFFNDLDELELEAPE